MANQAEGTYAGEFIVSEANGTRSRENVVIVTGAGVLPAGRMLGKITATGKYKNYDDAAADGSQAAAAILIAPVDASGASDVPAAVLMRDCEVVDARVTAANSGHKAAGKTDLAALGFIFR